jgi:glycine/D-amino acid oxidase-like deaminating enzyme
MAKRVIVVGSGIIGASIAYHLAKAGAEVTVIEAGETAFVPASEIEGDEQEARERLGPIAAEFKRLDAETTVEGSVRRSRCESRMTTWSNSEKVIESTFT